MSIKIEDLINKLNNEIPSSFKAKLGGSMVLKGLKLLERPAEDVDIIISRSFFFNKQKEDVEFTQLYNVLADLFPLQELHDMKSSFCYENMPQENYKYNLKVCQDAYVFGNKVDSINFLVQKDYIAEDYYSDLSLFGVPCVGIVAVLDAKRSYNRPKDLVDFHEMQKIMFFNK
jgi:hypothetical protein